MEYISEKVEDSGITGVSGEMHKAFGRPHVHNFVSDGQPGHKTYRETKFCEKVP